MRTSTLHRGHPIERFEDLRFRAARGEFVVDDISREGLLHAAVLRSPVAHGRIRSIDAARASRVAGRAFGDHRKDLGNRIPNVPMRLQPMPEFEAFAQPVIAQSKVTLRRRGACRRAAASPAIARTRLNSSRSTSSICRRWRIALVSARGQGAAVRGQRHEPLR